MSPPVPRSGSPPGGGFTLIEVLISVMILGILAGVGMPVLMNLLDQRGTTAAGLLKTHLDHARGAAVAAGRAHRVVFDLPGNAYVLQSETAPGSWVPATDPLTRRPARTAYSLLPHLSGVTLFAADFGGSATVAFDPYGFPSAPGAATLRSGTRDYIVRVADTGQVTLTLPE